jgi:alpha-1,3-rhamnosyl/mannosyltransferase
VPGAYTLFTGTVEPRKNIGTLLDAYSRLPAALRGRCPLVVCGYRGWQSDALHRRLEEAQAQGWVKYLGFVSNEMLPLLMAGARLFAYPSVYEGFGLPVLEAMASGVPVVCSNATTLPEVTGGAAAMHEPNDVDTLLVCLQQGLEDGTWRHEARERGLVRADQFSWERCASETMAVYKAVVDGTSA